MRNVNPDGGEKPIDGGFDGALTVGKIVLTVEKTRLTELFGP